LSVFVAAWAMSVAEAVVFDRVRDIAGLPHVTAPLSYIVPTAEKPHSYMYEPPPGVPKISATYEKHSTIIRSMRPIAREVSLDVEGFTLLNHHSRVSDFYNEDEVRSRH